MTSARGYVFTINNPTQTTQETMDHLSTTFTKTFKYCALALEQGENKTIHIQGYIEFKTPIDFKSIKKALPTAHIEKRQGTPKQARDYIFKEDTKLEPPIEQGELKNEQGKRTDLDDIAELLEEGIKPSKIRRMYPSQYIRYSQHIHRIHQEVQEEKYQVIIRDVQVIYVHGPSRTGKTSGIYNYHGMEDVYRVTNYDNPFDTYNGQDVIVLEEFHSSLPMTYMLQLLEGYPIKLKARYSDKVACFTRVYIVTNRMIADQYTTLQGEQPKTFEAFLNRIDYIVEVKSPKMFQNALQIIDGTVQLTELLLNNEPISIKTPKRDHQQHDQTQDTVNDIDLPDII